MGGGADAAMTPEGGADGGTTHGGDDGGGSGPVGVGAHAIVVDDANGPTHQMLTTPPVTTRASGSTFVLFAGYHQGEVAGYSDSMGNQYTPVGTPVTYSMSPGYYLAAFVCVRCKGGAGHTFSIDKAVANDEATLFAVEATGGPSVDAFVQADSTTNPISAGSVTTKHAGELLLLCVLGNSYGGPDEYTPSTGFTRLDENTNGSTSMAGADAYQVVGAPGMYTGTLQSTYTMPAGGSAAFLVALGL